MCWVFHNTFGDKNSGEHEPYPNPPKPPCQAPLRRARHRGTYRHPALQGRSHEGPPGAPPQRRPPNAGTDGVRKGALPLSGANRAARALQWVTPLSTSRAGVSPNAHKAIAQGSLPLAALFAPERGRFFYLDYTRHIYC